VEDEVVEGEHREGEVDSVLVEEVAEAEVVVSREVEVVDSRLEVEGVREEASPGAVDESFLLISLCRFVGVQAPYVWYSHWGCY